MIRLFNLVLVPSFKPHSKFPTYDGSLNSKELIDSINTLDTYFDYEEVDEAKKVKFYMTKIRGHTSICWARVQAERRSKGNEKNKNYSKMVTKLKGKFLPKDY